MAHQSLIFVESGAIIVSGKTSGPVCTKSVLSSRMKSRCSYKFSACSSESMLQKFSSANRAAGEYPINNLEFCNFVS